MLHAPPHTEAPARDAGRTEALTQECGPIEAVTAPPAVRREERPAPGRYLDVCDRLIALHTPSVRVGRNPSADIVLDDASVSRRHALIAVREGQSVVLDDRSLNGTWVNGERVRALALNDGDEIAFGRVRARFVEVSPG
jgi:pSer/pThr/pTyr-binding forkhead associated (FHA) protein